MTPQFTSARRRMVGWSMLVVSLLVLAVGAVTYETTTQSLMQSTDASLSASSAAAQLEINEGEARGELLQQGYRAGLFYLVVGPDGSIVSNPQRLDLSQTPATLWTSGGPRFMTTTINSDTVRIYTRPITSSSGSTLVLIVGQGLLSLQAATQQLLVTLVVGGVFGVLLACAGAWFLATRALGPIQRAFDRQQEFVADASHELRTPLTILHSSADLLAGQTDQPGFDRVQLVQEMRQEVIRMERLTRDLLTLARSDRGELRVAIGRVNLGALADELMRRVAVLADARNVHVERDDAAAAVSVEGDPDRLQEVGLIVLDNALKHTPEGGSIWIASARTGATECSRSTTTARAFRRSILVECSSGFIEWIGHARVKPVVRGWGWRLHRVCWRLRTGRSR